MSTRMEFAVTGMHCTSCGLLIDDEVEELPGVTSSTTSMRTGRTVIEHDGTLDAAAVLTAINEAGYTATPIS